MKTLISCLILFLGFQANAQLVFKNNNNAANNIVKLTITNNKTEIFSMVGNKETLSGSWDKVPLNYSSEDAQNQFKITLTKSDNIAKRTYEIHYSLYRQTNKYVGYIKSTFEYFDKRPKKIIEDRFTI